MESFRNPKFVQRYKDVSFDLQTPLVTEVANGAHQIKTGYRFVADNTGEVAPFDWYNARLETDFKLQLLADGGNIAVDDRNGMVNGSHSLIKEVIVKVNGISVYDCNNANHSVNIKNLLEYDRSYAKSVGTNQFYFLDTSGSADDRVARNTYNKGFHSREVVLGASATVNTEIPLNRYSFFESLEDQLLPNTKVEIQITLESDANLVWQAGADCRVVITKFRLWVPKIEFTPQGESQYMSKYLAPHKWTYLKEMVERGNSTRQQTGTFKISSGINRPRHVFVWISNDANQDAQANNPFLYNTFSVANARTLTSCQLEVGNGNHYPENEYQPSTEMTRVYRDALKYVHGVNDYKGGPLLTRANFSTIFQFVYFNLENQKLDIKDGTTKLTFKYRLSAGTNADYSVYALVLYEQDLEITQSNGKLILRA